MRLLAAVLAVMALAGSVLAASSFVIAVDGSGSMKDKFNGTVKFEIARDAAICMLDSMQEGDEGAIFVFEDSHTVTRAHSFTTSKGALRSALQGMDSEFGSTDLGSGINVSATYLLSDGKNQNKFLVVVSDGGDARAVINETAAYFRDQGVRLEVVGVGVRSTDRAGKVLAGIAENGGGRFYSTLDYSEPCGAFSGAYDNGVRGGGGLCPLFFLLPAAIVLLLTTRYTRSC